MTALADIRRLYTALADVLAALGAGALCVSASDESLWAL